VAGRGWWQDSASYPVSTSGLRTVVGCQDGNLYLLAGKALTKAVAAHTGPVNVVVATSDGCATGGHDGLVKVTATWSGG
jgi:hypothetical protein